MSWRVAHSLLHMLEQLNATYPARKKDSDGTIGDARHQAESSSDHNPWVHDKDGQPVVTALDVTHDPASGCTGQKLADALVASRDLRIKYLIWNRHICSSVVAPWTWRPYHGSSPHTEHVHISVKPQQSFYDDNRDWHIG